MKKNTMNDQEEEEEKVEITQKDQIVEKQTIESSKMDSVGFQTLLDVVRQKLALTQPSGPQMDKAFYNVGGTKMGITPAEAASLTRDFKIKLTKLQGQVTVPITSTFPQLPVEDIRNLKNMLSDMGSITRDQCRTISFQLGLNQALLERGFVITDKICVPNISYHIGHERWTIDFKNLKVPTYQQAFNIQRGAVDRLTKFQNVCQSNKRNETELISDLNNICQNYLYSSGPYSSMLKRLDKTFTGIKASRADARSLFSQAANDESSDFDTFQENLRAKWALLAKAIGGTYGYDEIVLNPNTGKYQMVYYIVNQGNAQPPIDEEKLAQFKSATKFVSKKKLFRISEQGKIFAHPSTAFSIQGLLKDLPKPLQQDLKGAHYHFNSLVPNLGIIAILSMLSTFPNWVAPTEYMDFSAIERLSKGKPLNFNPQSKAGPAFQNKQQKDVLAPMAIVADVIRDLFSSHTERAFIHELVQNNQLIFHPDFNFSGELSNEYINEVKYMLRSLTPNSAIPKQEIQGVEKAARIVYGACPPLNTPAYIFYSQTLDKQTHFPESKTLYKLDQYSGGLERLKTEAYNQLKRLNNGKILPIIYSDNLYMFHLDDKGDMTMSSWDGSSMESGTSSGTVVPKILSIMMYFMPQFQNKQTIDLYQSYNPAIGISRANFNPSINSEKLVFEATDWQFQYEPDKHLPQWLFTFMTSMYHLTGFDFPAVFGQSQVLVPGMASGIMGTYQLNTMTSSQIIKIVEGLEPNDVYHQYEGTWIPNPYFLSLVGALTGVQFRLENVSEAVIQGTLPGTVKTLDLLGNDQYRFVLGEVDVVIPILNKNRLFKSIMFAKYQQPMAKAIALANIQLDKEDNTLRSLLVDADISFEYLVAFIANIIDIGKMTQLYYMGGAFLARTYVIHELLFKGVAVQQAKPKVKELLKNDQLLSEISYLFRQVDLPELKQYINMVLADGYQPGDVSIAALIGRATRNQELETKVRTEAYKKRAEREITEQQLIEYVGLQFNVQMQIESYNQVELVTEQQLTDLIDGLKTNYNNTASKNGHLILSAIVQKVRDLVETNQIIATDQTIVHAVQITLRKPDMSGEKIIKILELPTEKLTGTKFFAAVRAVILRGEPSYVESIKETQYLAYATDNLGYDLLMEYTQLSYEEQVREVIKIMNPPGARKNVHTKMVTSSSWGASQYPFSRKKGAQRVTKTFQELYGQSPFGFVQDLPSITLTPKIQTSRILQAFLSSFSLMFNTMSITLADTIKKNVPVGKWLDKYYQGIMKVFVYKPGQKPEENYKDYLVRFLIELTKLKVPWTDGTYVHYITFTGPDLTINKDWPKLTNLPKSLKFVNRGMADDQNVEAYDAWKTKILTQDAVTILRQRYGDKWYSDRTAIKSVYNKFRRIFREELNKVLETVYNDLLVTKNINLKVVTKIFDKGDELTYDNFLKKFSLETLTADNLVEWIPNDHMKTMMVSTELGLCLPQPNDLVQFSLFGYIQARAHLNPLHPTLPEDTVPYWLDGKEHRASAWLLVNAINTAMYQTKHRLLFSLPPHVSLQGQELLAILDAFESERTKAKVAFKQGSQNLVSLSSVRTLLKCYQRFLTTSGPFQDVNKIKALIQQILMNENTTWARAIIINIFSYVLFILPHAQATMDEDEYQALIGIIADKLPQAFSSSYADRIYDWFACLYLMHPGYQQTAAQLNVIYLIANLPYMLHQKTKTHLLTMLLVAYTDPDLSHWVNLGNDLGFDMLKAPSPNEMRKLQAIVGSALSSTGIVSEQWVNKWLEVVQNLQLEKEKRKMWIDWVEEEEEYQGENNEGLVGS